MIVGAHGVGDLGRAEALRPRATWGASAGEALTYWAGALCLNLKQTLFPPTWDVPIFPRLGTSHLNLGRRRWDIARVGTT